MNRPGIGQAQSLKQRHHGDLIDMTYCVAMLLYTGLRAPPPWPSRCPLLELDGHTGHVPYLIRVFANGTVRGE